MRPGALVLVAVLVAVAAGGIAYWVSISFERYTETVERGYRGEARYNPLLAAERFLNRAGVSARSRPSLRTLRELPPVDHVLIVATQRQDLGAGPSSELLDWVAEGGHLVVVARLDADAATPDPLLAPLDVQVLPPLEEEEKDEDLQAAAQGEAEDGAQRTGDDPAQEPEAGAEDVVLNVAVDGLDAPLTVAFAPDAGLVEGEVEAAWFIGTKQRAQALGYDIGDGWLTVFSDAGFMENAFIGRHDHAALLWHLVHLGGKPEGVWLIHEEDMPSLAALLWAHARPAVVAALVLLLAWVWAAGGRFGPLLPDPQPVRRSLREHIAASGRFLWRQRQSEALLAPVQAALQAAIEARHPGWQHLPQDQLEARLAGLTGLPLAQVHAALASPERANELDFTRSIAILETIRNRL